MRTFVLALYLFLLTPVTVSAVVPPDEMWFTLFTNHFRVHHTRVQESYAKEFARYLENALPKLTKDLGWTPHTPIDIVINDISDSANGFAMSFPKNQLEVYAVPFGTESTLMDYKNWVEELAIHELTHIIANDTSLAGYKTLRSIFGSIAKPNGAQPVWIVEGLAVYEETAHTDAGRGRGAITESILRTAIQHGALGAKSYLSLDRMNDGVFWWPGGNTPYLLGYTIQGATEKENLAQDRSLPGQISTNNATKIPFQPNSNLVDAIGKEWQQSWQETISRLEKRYASTFPKDAENPAFCRLTKAGRFTGGHALSQDGQWIYFHLEDKEQGESLARIPMSLGACATSEPEILEHHRIGGTAQVSVHPEGNLVAYSAGDFITELKLFYDIYLYNVKEKKSHRLTHGKRAFDPTFVGAGEIAYIRNNGDNTQSIELANLSGENAREIFRTKKFERISNPVHHSARIYFSLHNNNGQEEIVSVSRDGGSAAATVPNFGKGKIFFERTPFFDANENLYFAANYRDVEPNNKFHVYRMRKNSHKIEKVLESSSGVLLRPVATDSARLLVNNYTLEGLDLELVTMSAPTALKKKSAKEEDLYKFLTGKNATPMTSPALGTQETTEYNVFKTPATSLWPQYWLPVWEATLDGSFIGANTSGMDPLGQNTYSLTMLYDTRTIFPTYKADYINRDFSAHFHLFAEQENDYFQGSSSSNRVALYGLETIVPYSYSALAFGTAYQTRALFSSNTHSLFLFSKYAYSKLEQSPAAVDPNRGEFLSTRLGVHPSTSFEKDYLDSISEISFYFRGLRSSHSLGLNLHAGITTNRLLASNYYLGGGASPLSNTNFIVRGYPTDTLLGQRIATANLRYTLPLAKPYRGFGTEPIFLRDIALRFHADAGSANFLARYNKGDFLGYQSRKLGYHVIGGGGVDAVFKGTLFYYVPMELVLGVHRGLQPNFGGQTLFYLALNGAINPYAMNHEN